MEWKRIFNKKVLLLTTVCIIINCALFLYQEMSSTQIRKDYDRYISAKNSYVEEYNSVVGNISDNASKMNKYGIFTKQDSFAYNNILRTRKDFARIGHVNVEVHDDRAIEAMVGYNMSFMIVFALMIMAIYNMFLERDNGVWQVAHCTRYGRVRLALERLGIIIAGSGIILAAFSISIYGTAVVIYGIGDGLLRPVQELIGFSRFTHAYSKGFYLVYLYLVSWVIIAALSICVWGIMTIIRERNHALIFVIIFIGVEFLLRRNIEPQSVYNGFYYANIVSMLYVNELLTTYLNWGFKTYVFGSFQTCMLLLLMLALGLGSFAVMRYDGMYPRTGSSDSLLSKLAGKIKNIYHRVMSRYSVLMMEIHKVFFTGKGAWVLLVVIVLAVYFCASERMIYTQAASDRDAYYVQHGGKDYSAIENKITEEINRYQELMQIQETKKKEHDEGLIETEEFMEASSAVAYQASIVKGLEEYENKLAYLDEIEQRYGIHGYMMSDRGIEMVLSDKSYSRELVLLLVIVVGIMMINSECVTLEQRNGIHHIIHGAKNGRKSFWVRKVLAGMICSLGVYTLVYAVDAAFLLKFYDFQYMGAPAISLTFMGENPNFIVLHTAIWQFILIKMMVKLVIALMCAGGAILLSAFISRKGNRALMPIAIAVVVMLVVLAHMKFSWLI